MDKDLENELIRQIVYFPGLGKLSASETLAVVRLIKAGIKGFVEYEL